jgi:regulator of protease activity HflC (stomatin/prohibitin superfamily)
MKSSSLLNGKAGRSLGQKTTLIKVMTIVILNVVTFTLASIIAPAPNPQGSVFWNLTRRLPGGLYLLGEVAVRLLVILLNRNALRYLLIANLAALIPLLFGARFIQQLYKFSSFGEALSYLIDAFVVHPDYFLTPQPGRDAEHPSYHRGLSGIRFAVIKNGKLLPGKKKPRNRSIALAGGPGLVIVPPEYAVQLERDGRLGYVVGPGVVNLGRFEKVYKPINLRRIVRSHTVQALTRDGIPVEVEVTVQARVQASSASTDKVPHPFDKSAIRKLVLSTPASKSGPADWEERPGLLIGSVLNEVLAKYRLDLLFDPEGKKAYAPRPTIQKEIERTMRQRSRGFGVEIAEVWLGDFQLPKEVTEQYLAYWKTDWQNQDRTKLADGDAAVIRERNQARLEAHQLILDALIDAFKSAQKSRPDIPTKQLAALRLIDALQEIYYRIGGVDSDSGRRVVALDRSLASLRRAVQTQVRPEEVEPDASG